MSDFRHILNERYKPEFLLINTVEIDPKNEFDRWFLDLFFILSYIYTKLSFNTMYMTDHIVIDKFLKFLNHNPIKSIYILKENNYYQERIPKILEGLHKLQAKIIKKRDVKLETWAFKDFGVKDLNEILSTF